MVKKKKKKKIEIIKKLDNCSHNWIDDFGCIWSCKAIYYFCEIDIIILIDTTHITISF